MKKAVYLYWGVLLCSVFSVSAQTSFGVKGGFAASSLSGDFTKAIGQKSLMGFNAGFLAEFSISDRFSLQPEAYFSQQGNQIVKETGEEIKYHLNYVNVPLLAKFYLVEGYSSIEFGPQLGIQTNEKLDPAFTDRKYARDFDLGLAGGLSYKFDNGVFCSLRYNYGFSDIFITGVLLGNGYSKTRSVMFDVGYMF